MTRLLLLSVAVGCVPDLAIDESTITAPTVLAVQVSPAEAAPGQEVTLTAILAVPDGSAPPSGIEWAFCVARRRLTDNGPVSGECLNEVALAAASEPVLLPLTAGILTTGALPAAGCELFGPNPPPVTSPGEPAGRPETPDVTGGYYQPVRLEDATGATGDSVSITRVRLACGIAGATQKVSADYTQRYHTNTNPAATDVVLVDASGGETPLADAASPTVVAAGQTVTLRANWAECPAEGTCDDGVCSAAETATTCAADCAPTAKGCGGAEVYLRYDSQEGALVSQREALRVSWHSTAGRFGAPRTGVGAGAGPSTGSANTWTAPTAAGRVTLWVVLRDDRGGVGAVERVLDVR